MSLMIPLDNLANEFIEEFTLRRFAIEAEPVKHGRWEHKLFDEKYSIWLYHCSACGGVSAQQWNYCRECGAKMDLVGEKNERV